MSPLCRDATETPANDARIRIPGVVTTRRPLPPSLLTLLAPWRLEPEVLEDSLELVEDVGHVAVADGPEVDVDVDGVVLVVVAAGSSGRLRCHLGTVPAPAAPPHLGLGRWFLGRDLAPAPPRTLGR